MSFANPHLLWALLLIPLLILLRLLLPRRRRIETAVLSIWQAAADRVPKRTRVHANRSDVLLAVLLVAVALLTLAAAGLQRSDERLAPPEITVLIDASPSMNAIEPNGRTRTMLAEQRIEEITTTVYGYGNDLPIPADIESIGPRGIEQAAAEEATRGPVLLATDLPCADGVNLRVVHVGTPLENLAIAAFATGENEVFVRVVRFGGDGTRSVKVSLFGGVGGEPAGRTAARTLTVERTAVADFPFDLNGLDWLCCRISPPEGEAGPLDALAWDDLAWLSRRWSDRIGVHRVGTPSKWLRRAMADDPRVAWSEYGDTAARPSGADLLIANVTGVADDARWMLQILDGEQAVPAEARMSVGVDSDDPLLKDVDLAAVRVARRAAPLAAGTGSVLATLGGEPAIVRRTVGNQTVVQIGFSIEQTNTNWVTHRSFPVFLSRLIEQVRRGRPVAFANEFAALPIYSRVPAVDGPHEGRDLLVLRDPTAKAAPADISPHGILTNAGCYLLPADGRRLPVAAWSASAEESDLTTAEATAFDAAAYVASLPKQWTGSITPLWPWLLAAAVLVLAVGWGGLRR